MPWPTHCKTAVGSFTGLSNIKNWTRPWPSSSNRWLGGFGWTRSNVKALMRTGPILLAASGEGAVPSPARLLLTHTLPSKPTTTTLMTQIFVAIAHLHGKVAGIYLVVGAYSIYGPGAEH